MLSVLIIDTKILDHYSKYNYFFGYFEAHKDVVACEWNRQNIGDDISNVVPQLMDAIRNVPEWNAYVICEPHNSLEYLKSDFENQTQFSINPYERANHEGYDREKDKLLQLLYFLGGRNSDNVEYIEQYQFRAARPNNIYVITPRILKNIEQQKHFLLSDIREKYRNKFSNISETTKILSQEDDLTMNYSEFWERYEYPSICRFMVYDFPEEKHQSYQDSWFAFWIMVISMTQNRFNNAVMAPFKLHVVNIEVSDSRFEEYINKFYTMLLERKQNNEQDIEKETLLEKEELTSTDITVGDSTTPIYVTLPFVDTNELTARDDEIGIVKDRPTLDETYWRKQMRHAKEAMVRFFKAIGRGKSEAVDFVHEEFENELPDLKGKHLSKYDKEELTDAINNDEYEMIKLDLAFRGSRAEFEKKQEKADKIVRTYMRHRLRFKIAAWLIGACMLIYFLGFLPYLVNSISHSLTSFLFALPISLGALLVPLGCGILALYILKRKLSKLIMFYNDVVEGCINEVLDCNEIRGKYLTFLLDYMKKYQMLANAASNEVHSQNIQKMITANLVFDHAISECVALAALNNIIVRQITDRYIENTIDPMPESRLYLYEENKGGTMALNSTKDALNAPFSFINQFLIECEELCECIAYGGYEVSPTEEASVVNGADTAAVNNTDETLAPTEGGPDNTDVVVPTDVGNTDSAVSTDTNSEEVTE